MKGPQSSTNVIAGTSASLHGFLHSGVVANISILQVEYEQLRTVNFLSQDCRVPERLYMHENDYIASLCGNGRTLWHDSVLNLAVLLELGHIQRHNDTVPDHLLRVIQKLPQRILHSLLVT
jgi:hypothetical protein